MNRRIVPVSCLCTFCDCGQLVHFFVTLVLERTAGSADWDFRVKLALEEMGSDGVLADEVNSELAAFTEACQAVYDASNPKVHRTRVERDHYGAHDRLVMAYFSENPQYDEATFRDLRQLAYGCVPDSLDEYLQMGATTARDSLRIFCKVIMNLYGEEILRKPTYTDMEKLYAYHDESSWFPGELGQH
ncbi:hypothetical protein Tco_0956933 [Tanacetum coccineum]